MARRPLPIPGPIYLDTSALVKIYLPEPESAVLDRSLVGRQDLLVSDLALTEVASAVARRQREGSLPDAVGARIYRRLLSDVEEGFFLRLSVVPETHRDAERILMTSRVALRTLDALHLSLAVGAAAASLATFDRRMGAAAATLGLTVFPGAPE